MLRYMDFYCDYDNQISTTYLFPEEYITNYNLDIKDDVYYGHGFEKLFKMVKTHLSTKCFGIYTEEKLFEEV